MGAHADRKIHPLSRDQHRIDSRPHPRDCDHAVLYDDRGDVRRHRSLSTSRAAQGVVEPAEMKELFAGNDGFVSQVPALAGAGADGKEGGTLAMLEAKPGDLLMSEVNPELEAQHSGLMAMRAGKVVEKGMYLQAKQMGRCSWRRIRLTVWMSSCRAWTNESRICS